MAAAYRERERDEMRKVSTLATTTPLLLAGSSMSASKTHLLAYGKWQMANGRWRIADSLWQSATGHRL